jgi:hypothetical protein
MEKLNELREALESGLSLTLIVDDYHAEIRFDELDEVFRDSLIEVMLDAVISEIEAL